MGEHWGALGRSNRTFMIEQQAMLDEMPTVVTALGARRRSRGGGLGRLGPGRPSGRR